MPIKDNICYFIHHYVESIHKNLVILSPQIVEAYSRIGNSVVLIYNFLVLNGNSYFISFRRPRRCFIFRWTSSIWACHDKVSSKITPRYFNSVTLTLPRCSSLITMVTSLKCCNLRLIPISMNLDAELVMVDFRCRKPCWLGINRLLSWIKLFSWTRADPSTILGRVEIGR